MARELLQVRLPDGEDEAADAAGAAGAALDKRRGRIGVGRTRHWIGPLRGGQPQAQGSPLRWQTLRRNASTAGIEAGAADAADGWQRMLAWFRGHGVE